MAESLVISKDNKGILSSLCGENDSLLFFFLILVVLFTNCDMFNGSNDSLLFFFLLLVVLFTGGQFF